MAAVVASVFAIINRAYARCCQRAHTMAKLPDPGLIARVVIPPSSAVRPTIFEPSMPGARPHFRVDMVARESSFPFGCVQRAASSDERSLPTAEAGKAADDYGAADDVA